MLLPAKVARLWDPIFDILHLVSFIYKIKFSIIYYTSLMHYVYITYNTSFVRMEFVLGWGVLLLCKVFGGLCPHLRRQYIFNQKLVYWIFRV